MLCYAKLRSACFASLCCAPLHRASLGSTSPALLCFAMLIPCYARLRLACFARLRIAPLHSTRLRRAKPALLCADRAVCPISLLCLRGSAQLHSALLSYAPHHYACFARLRYTVPSFTTLRLLCYAVLCSSSLLKALLRCARLRSACLVLNPECSPAHSA